MPVKAGQAVAGEVCWAHDRRGLAAPTPPKKGNFIHKTWWSCKCLQKEAYAQRHALQGNSLWHKGRADRGFWGELVGKDAEPWASWAQELWLLFTNAWHTLGIQCLLHLRETVTKFQEGMRIEGGSPVLERHVGRGMDKTYWFQSQGPQQTLLFSPEQKQECGFWL